MTHQRTLASSALGSLIICSFAAAPTAAQTYVRSQDYVTPQTYAGAPDYVSAGNHQIVGGRCADFGADFIDMGNGVCGRVGSTARVQLGTRGAGMNEWTSSATTSATLRSDSLLPGAAVQHLRVRGYAPGSPLQ